VFWVISVYFNIRNTLPKSGTFLLGHPVYIDILQCRKRRISFTLSYKLSIKFVLFNKIFVLEYILCYLISKLHVDQSKEYNSIFYHPTINGVI